MSFAAPELLPFALTAPLLGLLAAWALARRARAERAWVARVLEPRLRSGGGPRPAALTSLVIGLTVLGLALALARPRWGSATETVERQGLDLVFVIDTSLSMSAADISPSRYWLAQSLVRRLVAELPGHRVALVAAEGEGEVLTPLTVDAAVVDLVLDGLVPGSLPLPGTRLADAIVRAVGLYPPGGGTHRALVVLSDGEDHGGGMERAHAALREAGVRVFAVGVGSAAGAPIPLAGPGGGFKRDQRGEVVISRLDDEVLMRLADASDGDYFAAPSAAFDTGPLTRAIEALGGRAIESATTITLEERFQWPLALAVAALAAGLIAGPYAQRRREPDA